MNRRDEKLEKESRLSGSCGSGSLEDANVYEQNKWGINMDKIVFLGLQNIIKNYIKGSKIVGSSTVLNCNEEREKAVKQWSFIRQLN